MLLFLVALHAALAGAAPALARRFGRGALLVCAAAPAGTAALAVARAPAIVAGGAHVERWDWAPSLGMDAALRLDGFALAMVALVAGLGVLVFVYAYGYFAQTPQAAGLGRFSAALTGFAGAMLGLVLADNVLLLYVFWELTSITSYVLIGFSHQHRATREAALQALLITSAGGLAMLAGLVILAQQAGTYELSGIVAAAPRGGLVSVAVVLVLLGAFTKSAQVPFHSWLPAAMVAPTPVSAYLHAATMVKAGPYLLARLAPGLAATPPWRPLVITVGVASMLLGAWHALRQVDGKLLLAFGTISQLGLLTVLLGAGVESLAFAGVVLLFAHALFKGALFMVIGVADKAAGTRVLDDLRSAARALPTSSAAALLAGASMAGVPLLFGFVAKEAAVEGLLQHRTGALGDVALFGVLAGSVLTVAYTVRFVRPFVPWVAAAGGDLRWRPPWVLVAPAAILAAGSLLVGLRPGLADGPVQAATLALWPGAHPEPLELWHGFGAALWLSALVLTLGAGVGAAAGPVGRLQARLPRLVDGGAVYEATLRGTLRGARAVTAVLQNGSLPMYLSVICLTLVMVPGSVLVLRASMPPLPRFAANEMQAAVAVFAIAAALGAVLTRWRFAAVLFLGALGYAVALLFVVHGAPDLALTQLLVETLSIVVFVLVLRHLPPRFRERGRAELPGYRILRAAVAVAVGSFVFVFALISAAARTAEPVSVEHLARAVPDAAGRNVVNVLLVDFRALDTLGEITVLVVAALGILSLVGAVRSERDAGRDGAVGPRAGRGER